MEFQIKYVNQIDESEKTFSIYMPDDFYDDEFEEAVNLLSTELCYKRLGCPCTRNDSAVNIMCCLRVIYPQYRLPREYVDKAMTLIGLCGVPAPNRDILKEHFERVAPYLFDWGPEDHWGQALSYMI